MLVKQRRDDEDGGITSPFPCRGFVPRPVGFIDMCDFWDEWVVGIWIREHGAD